MGDEAYGGDLAFLVSFAFWRLVFFLYTSLEISPKLGYILYVCALARLISASSKEKILRLDFLRSNFEVKFINFSSNFIHRDPHLENVKFANLVSYEINIPDGLCVV